MCGLVGAWRHAPSATPRDSAMHPAATQGRVKQNLDYIYVPGVSPPFDDPLVRLIRQVAAYSGELRSCDHYLGI